MNYYKLIILTFIVTALWDVILRFMALNYEKLPSPINKTLPFIKDLKPYFEKHTLLAAALIAGFVGATTQPIILKNSFFFSKNLKFKKIIIFLIISFIISALYGFIMKWSNLFPRLEEHYYNKLGLVRSMYHDGISGLIVQVTLLIMLNLKIL